MRTADRFGEEPLGEDEDEIVAEDVFEPAVFADEDDLTVTETDEAHAQTTVIAEVISPRGETRFAEAIAGTEAAAVATEIETLRVESEGDAPAEESPARAKGRGERIAGWILVGIGAFIVLFAIYEFFLSGLY